MLYFATIKHYALPPPKKKPKQEIENKYTVKTTQSQYPPKLTIRQPENFTCTFGQVVYWPTVLQ